MSRRSCYSHVKSPEPRQTRTATDRSTKTPTLSFTARPRTTHSPPRSTASSCRNRSQEPAPALKASPCLGTTAEDVNDSTAASSTCESQQDVDPTITSSRVLFAKASELIRVEIAAVERRLIARVEMERKATGDKAANDLELLEKHMSARIDAERSERKVTCDKMATDLEAMIGIVERLSTQSESKCLSVLEQERHVFDTLLEEERGLRDMACATLFEKLENIGSQVSTFPNVVDGINGVLDQEKQTSKALESSLQSLSEDISFLKSEKEAGVAVGVDEARLKEVLEVERRTHDVAFAKLRTELRKEVEDMALEVRSLVVRAPLYERLERQQKDAEIMCIKLRQDIDMLLKNTRNGFSKD